MHHLKAVICALTICCWYLVEGVGEDPLILTPLLEAGKFTEAQKLSLVTPDIGGIKSYTGFFTVNKTCENNLFFWFVPAQKDWESAPVLLWLNGGPGTSSLMGMFTEIGPFTYDKKKGCVANKYHWSLKYNVVFLDQPVGTGFSFSKKNVLPTDLSSVTKDAYEALLQFFKLFPGLQKNKFFMTGESYAGHYIPAIAEEIDMRNNNASLKINLFGIIVGNPWLDVRCIDYGQFLYQVGIVDEKVRDKLQVMLQNTTKYVNANDAENAGKSFRPAWGEIKGDTGIPSIYNFLYDSKEDITTYQLFIRNYQIRKLIHVGNTAYIASNNDVFSSLYYNLFKPNSNKLEYLLNSTKYIVGLYSGQVDVIAHYTSLPCVLRQLKWPGAADYLSANRTQWHVGDRLAGWYKTAGNLFEVVFRDGGHFVPTDQPEAALEFITAAVGDSPGSKLLTKLKTEAPE